MPNCDFYAAGADFHGILEFVFLQPAWTLVELASIPDHPLVGFDSPEDLMDAYDLGRSDVRLQLYAATMGGGIIERHIALNPGAVGDAKGRTDSEGWGLIQLYLSGERDGQIGLSHTNHNSEARARSWEETVRDRLGPVSAWNWTEVARISRRLNHHLRRTAVGRSGSRIILPHAAARVADGAQLAQN
ncbi:MAG: hypothetical protein QOI52_779 [Chloroflexota bacterium]|jgi:hypothetical protein|nr:hypothetical protein [Chloroflexota bacterium]